MAYLAAADFREETQESWCQNLILAEVDISDPLLEDTIAEVAAQVEVELDDDFDPPSPDNDETFYVDATVGPRLYIPRRVRSLTTVSRRNLSGTITAVNANSYRLHSSLNAGGTAMLPQRYRDWLDSGGWDTWYSSGDIQLVGKFGWAAVPWDIKRLVALRTYDRIKPTGDPLSQIVQRNTADATYTFGPSREEQSILSFYSRKMPAVA